MKTHKCQEQLKSKNELYIERESGYWELTITDGMDRIYEPINFCPYCGEKLEG